MSGSSLDLRTASLEQLKVRARRRPGSRRGDDDEMMEMMRDDDDDDDDETRTDDECERARDGNDRLPMNSCERR